MSWGSFIAGYWSTILYYLCLVLGSYTSYLMLGSPFINRVSIVATFPAGIFAQKFVS